VATCGEPITLRQGDILLSLPVDPESLKGNVWPSIALSGISELVSDDLEPATIRISRNAAGEPFEVVSWGPNPAREEYHVIVRTVAGTELKYEITDQEGRVRKAAGAIVAGDFHDLRFSREDFGGAGMYLLRIASGTGNWSDKVIIQ
jgi:hypothetical protein